MRWRVAGTGVLLAFGLTMAVLAADGRAHTQGAPVVTYAYKIELAYGTKEMKDLERRLSDAGRTGWRVSRVVAPSFEHEVLVVLEKPESR